MTTNPDAPACDGSTALVPLPKSVVRGAGVLMWVYGALIVGLALLVARHPPRLRTGWGLLRDLFLASEWIIFLIVIGLAIWQYRRLQRRSDDWVENVAPTRADLPTGGVAEVIAVNMAMSPNTIWMTRYQRLREAALACKQQLPWVWVDSAVVPLLAEAQRRGGERGSIRLRLWSPWSRWLLLALIGSPIVAAGVFLSCWAVLDGSDLAPVRRVGVIVAIMWAAGAIGYAALPRYAIRFLNGKALLLRRERIVRELAAGNSFVILTTCQSAIRLQSRGVSGVRWWFLLPGLPNLYVNDLRVEATPWKVSIDHAVAGPTRPEGWPGVCPECGYSTEGLVGSRCPECGGAVEPLPQGEHRERPGA